MNKRNIVLSFAAGLLGGAISYYVSPQLVHAESQAPKELRAQSFILVNEKGTILGTLSDEGGGRQSDSWMNVAARSGAPEEKSEFAWPSSGAEIPNSSYFRGMERSSSRLSSSTFTRGSPRKPRSRPSVWALMSVRI